MEEIRVIDEKVGGLRIPFILRIDCGEKVRGALFWKCYLIALKGQVAFPPGEVKEGGLSAEDD